MRRMSSTVAQLLSSLGMTTEIRGALLSPGPLGGFALLPDSVEGLYQAVSGLRRRLYWSGGLSHEAPSTRAATDGRVELDGKARLDGDAIDRGGGLFFGPSYLSPSGLNKTTANSARSDPVVSAITALGVPPSFNSCVGPLMRVGPDGVQGLLAWMIQR